MLNLLGWDQLHGWGSCITTQGSMSAPGCCRHLLATADMNIAMHGCWFEPRDCIAARLGQQGIVAKKAGWWGVAAAMSADNSNAHAGIIMHHRLPVCSSRLAVEWALLSPEQLLQASKWLS